MKDWKKLSYNDTFKTLVDNFNTNSDNSDFIDKSTSNILCNGVLYNGKETINGVSIYPFESVFDPKTTVTSDTILDNFSLYFRTTNNIVTLNLFPIDLLSYTDGKLYFLFIKEDLSYRVSRSIEAYVDEILLLRFSILPDLKWYQLYVVAKKAGTPIYDGEDEYYNIKGMYVTSEYGLTLNYTDGSIKRSGINFTDKNNPDFIHKNRIDDLGHAIREVPIIYNNNYNEIVYPDFNIDMGTVLYHYNYVLDPTKIITYDFGSIAKTNALEYTRLIKDMLFGIDEYTNNTADELHSALVSGATNDELLQILDNYTYFISDKLYSNVMRLYNLLGNVALISIDRNILQTDYEFIHDYLVDNLCFRRGSFIDVPTVTEEQVTYLRNLVPYLIETPTTTSIQPLEEIILEIIDSLNDITTSPGIINQVPTGKFSVQRILYDIYKDVFIVQYGNVIYDTFANAVEGTDKVNFPAPNDNSKNYVPLAVVILKNGSESISQESENLILDKRNPDVTTFSNENVDYVARTWALNQVPTDSVIGFEGDVIPSGYEEVFYNYYDILSRGDEIPSNADLNNYTSRGVFYSPQGSVTTTIQNIPSGVSVAFKLTVEILHLNNRILQRLVVNNATPTIYYRTYTGSWNSWHKVVVELA